MDETTTKFSRNGLLTGGLLILTEFILLSLFYAKADPVLFDGTVPHKFIFYIEFVLVVIIFSIVRTSEGLYEEVAVNAKSLSDFNLNIGRMFGFGIFASGCYILYYLLKARLFHEQAIFQFVNNNLYVSSIANPFAIINLFIFPLVQSFIYQGFLLNGLIKHMGYTMATILSSAFYGFWFEDPIGGMAMNLFLNAVYIQSKNILYPMVLAIPLNLAFAVVFLIKPEIWLLKAQSPHYNKELFKGVILFLVGAPVVVPYLHKMFKK